MARYDLHYQLVQPPRADDPVPLPPGQVRQAAGANFTVDFAHPVAVRGLQKCVNLWLKVFLTPKGSHPRRRDEGTDFAARIGGNVDPDDDLEGAILLDMEDATDQVKAIQARAPWLDADERLAGVDPLVFNRPSPDAVELWVEVRNVAGTRLPALIPYATTG